MSFLFVQICGFCLVATLLITTVAPEKSLKSKYEKCGAVFKVREDEKHWNSLGDTLSSAVREISKNTLTYMGGDLIARGVRNIDPILGLILVLQLKNLLLLPIFVLAAGLIGLKSLAASLVSVFFSGASLLRSLLPSANNNNAAANNRPGGASSRVAYEVRSPDLGPYVYPPSAVGLVNPVAARQPDVRIISAAANN